jgi:hypothetical protein
VLILTPGHSLVNNYVQSLTKTIEYLNNNGITWKWLNTYSSLVFNARETTISGDNNLNPEDIGPMHDMVTYDKMIWIDSDIEWSIEDFMKLYEAKQDIVSGVYLLANGETSTIVSADFPQGIPKKEINKLNDIFEITHCGFGFLAVKYGVFESIPRPWFTIINQPLAFKDGFNISLGEDISWCMKASNSGHKIYCDPLVKVNHLKTVKIGW